MSNMFSGFGDLDFSGLEDQEAPETLPTAGTAHLKVEDKHEVLFFTADWTLVATVGQHEFGRSTASRSAHTDAYKRCWVRQLIRENKARMRRLGVDVERTYLDWGGFLSDLED